MSEPARQTVTPDIDGIRSMLIELLAEGREQDVVELVVKLLLQLKQDNDRLNTRVLELLQARNWRKSEKIGAGQLRLFLEQALELEQQTTGETPDIELPSPIEPLKRRRTGKRTGRRPLPESLPRKEVVLEPTAEQKICAECNSAKTCIGHERSEVLDYVPGHFEVTVFLRAKVACLSCEGEISIGPTGPRPIDGGLPGFGLLSDVLVKKYADHTPLHRMRGIYRRLGVDLPVSTLAHWVEAGADALEPIAAAIRDEVLAAHVVQVDDTGLTVLDRAKSRGSKRGHMWGYVGDRCWVSYVYTPTREGTGPCGFLADRKGWIQADAFSGYDALFKPPDAVAIEVGCMAHARRYFVKALEKDCRAAVALHWIGKLYDVERTATEHDFDPESRFALRQEHSKGLLDKLGEWIKKTHPAAPPKSPLGRALTYMINQWQALSRFLDDGRLEIDNNGAERALRTIALGRNNWMFAGSDEGAKRAATIYTVFGTCRLNGVDPWTYVHDVLAELAVGRRVSRIDELLPLTWARTHGPDAQKPIAATA